MLAVLAIAVVARGSITLVAVGDVMLDRHVGRYIERFGTDYPLAKVRKTLYKADLVVANLECPLTHKAKLLQNRLSLAGHIWGENVGKKMDVVERKTDDSITPLGLLGNKLVAELVVLEKLIAKAGNKHNSSQTRSELGALNLGNILGEELVDLILVLLKGRELRKVIFGDLALKLGLGELDHALAQVTQVFEKIVVIDINKLPLKTSASNYFGRP